MKEGCKVSCVKTSELLEKQYLFEILHTYLTVKKSENVLKSGCFKKKKKKKSHQNFYEMKKGYKG